MNRSISGAKALPLTIFTLLCVSLSQAHAKPAVKPTPPPLGYAAIAKAEQATGKKLSAAQKAQIVKLAHQREDAIAKDNKMEWQKFRVSVAKVVGLSLAQMEAKEKAAHGKK